MINWTSYTTLFYSRKSAPHSKIDSGACDLTPMIAQPECLLVLLRISSVMHRQLKLVTARLGLFAGDT